MTRVDLTNLSTSYHITGEGRAIVWIAGGGGRATDWHTHYTEPFADSYQSITFDNRGTSGTTCVEELPWTVADMASDTVELIERLCDRPVVVIGHSLGALVALQAAVDRPDLIELVVSLAGAARGDRGWIGDYMRAEIELRKQGIRLTPAFSASHYAAMMYPASALQDDALWKQIRSDMSDDATVANIEDTIESQWGPCLTFDLTTKLPGLQIPVEAVCFSEDVCSPPRYSADLAALVARGRFHEMPGLGHSSLYGHRPREVSAFVRELVDAHFA